MHINNSAQKSDLLYLMCIYYIFIVFMLTSNYQYIIIQLVPAEVTTLSDSIQERSMHPSRCSNEHGAQKKSSGNDR